MANINENSSTNTSVVQASPPFRFTFTYRSNNKQDYRRIDNFTVDSFIETMMTREMEVAKKEGSGIIGAWFKPYSRLEQKNVETVTALIVDVDGKFTRNGIDVIESVDVDRFLAKLPFRGVAHSSYSATKQHSKFRAIYPLEEEITPEEHQRLWYWMYEQVEGLCDPACKNPDRMFYLPRINPDAPDGFKPWCRELQGSVLNYRKVVPAGYALPKGVVSIAKHVHRPGLHLATRSSQYATTDGHLVLNAFMTSELVAWAKDNPSVVSREVWRGIATNIGCIVNDHPGDEDIHDDCLAAFHEISCEDVDRYNEHDTDRLFKDALKSAAYPGPMTVETMRVNGAPAKALPADCKAVIAWAKKKAGQEERLLAAPRTTPSGAAQQSAAAPVETAALQPVPQVPHGESGGTEKTIEELLAEVEKRALDSLASNPMENFLFDVEANRYLIKDKAGKWITPGYTDTAFANWLVGEGIGRKGIDRIKSCIRTFTRKAPVYGKPTERYLLDDEQWTFNTYVPSTLQRAAGNWDDIKTLLMNLVGNDADAYEYFVQWLAAPVQAIRSSPGGGCRKMGTAVVLEGEEGGGKGTLHEIMKAIYGPCNVGIIGQGSLDSQFNSEMVNKLWVTANEVMSSTNRGGEAANKLKMWITDKEIPIQGKYRDMQLVKNTFNLLITSNEDVPVIVDRTDRRYSVFHSLPLSKEVGATVNADIDGPCIQVAAFLDHLVTLPITIKYGQLFTTEARTAMQEISLPSDIKFARELRRDGWLGVSLPWVEAGNPLKARLPLLVDDNIAASTMNEVYQHWCRSEGLKPRGGGRLSTALRKEFKEELKDLPKDPRCAHGGVQVRCWKNLPMHPGGKVLMFPEKSAPPGSTQTG